MTVLAAFEVEDFQGMTEVYPASVAHRYRGVFAADNLEYLRGGQRFDLLALLGVAEADFHHFGQVFQFHILQIHLLDAHHLFVVEPVGSLHLLQLVQHLGIKLFVVDVAHVVDELSLVDGQADVATTSRNIGQGMRIVGCRHEGGRRWGGR